MEYKSDLTNLSPTPSLAHPELRPFFDFKNWNSGSSNLLGGLKGVEFHGEFNHASLMTLKWCVFKRSQKNCFFRPKTAIFGQKIGSSNLFRGLKKIKFHGEFNYASPMALKWCVFKRSQKKTSFHAKNGYFWPKLESWTNMLIGNPHKTLLGVDA